MKKFGKKYPLVFGIVGFAVVFVLFWLINVEGNWMQGAERFCMSALLILIMWPAVGSRWLKFPGSGWKSSFGLYKIPLIVAGAFAVIVVIANLVMIALVSADPTGEIAQGMAANNMGTLNPNLLADFISTLFFMLSVGIFEELAFRRALFDMGMLQFPKMKNRAMWMAVISSFLFGFVHVMTMLSADWLAVITAILKIIGTGVMGFIMCAAVIDGQNIWPIAVIHMLNDFLLYLPRIFSIGNTMEINYVVTSTSGVSGLVAALPNVIITAISIPALIKSVKILKKYDEEHN